MVLCLKCLEGIKHLFHDNGSINPEFDFDAWLKANAGPMPGGDDEIPGGDDE